MQVYRNLQAYDHNPQNSALVLGIGNFDGIHVGHQELFRRGLESAKKSGNVCAAFTFQEHPQGILHPGHGPKLLMSMEQKVLMLERLGVEVCFLIPFTEKFSKIEARDFVETVLARKLHVDEVLMGSSARFGYERKGNARLMKVFAREYRFDFQEIEPIEVKGEVVSSSRVRELVGAGNLEEAKECLGRAFNLFGKVVKGDGRAKTLDFPTANLEVSSEVFPPEGVYSVRVREISFEKKKLREDLEDWQIAKTLAWKSAVLNFGRRPTFCEGSEAPSLEVHILDFKGDLYGKTLEVEFHKTLRAEKRFAGAKELAEQIKIDISQARQALSELV